jgi:hypothetical protein
MGPLTGWQLFLSARRIFGECNTEVTFLGLFPLDGKSRKLATALVQEQRSVLHSCRTCGTVCWKEERADCSKWTVNIIINTDIINIDAGRLDGADASSPFSTQEALTTFVVS